MKLHPPRALLVRLIAAELLARPGTGPLAPKYFVGPRVRAPRTRPDAPEAIRVENEAPSDDVDRAPR